MNENKTILTTRRYELWWRKAQAWFATQFASNTKSVTDKVDDAKAEILTAIDEAVTPVEPISDAEINELFDDEE